MPSGDKVHAFSAQAFFILTSIMINELNISGTVTASTSGRGRRGQRIKIIVWLNRKANRRVYYDLNQAEAAWLESIARAFDLSIKKFVRGFYSGKLQTGGPAYPWDQSRNTSRRPDLQKFTITCSDPAVWRQLDAIAKHNDEGNAKELCARAILGELQIWNEELIFHPKTSAILCTRDELRALGFWTGQDQEPPQHPTAGRWMRGVENFEQMKQRHEQTPSQEIGRNWSSSTLPRS